MPSLLVVIFLLQLAIHLINTVGVAAINELSWLLYNKLPTSTSHTVQNANELRQRLLHLKTEMASVSAQDDFAKWAKLRRHHDKLAADHDKAASSLHSSKAKFDSINGVARWLATTGLRFFLQFWCTKRPVFWLPNGLMPSYAEWLVSFPRAPWGSVSVQVWFLACAAAITLVGDGLTALNINVPGVWQSSPSGKGQPQDSSTPPSAETKGASQS